MDTFTKQSSEEFQISVDFSESLSDNDPIASYTINAYLSNTDVTSDIILTSYKATSSILITVKGGDENCNYKIVTKITSELGEIYEKDIQMEVREI